MTLPRTLRWYESVAPVTATVDCEGAAHRVTWRRGKVVLEDHDLTAERTMLVFGGELCTCMRVLEMWKEQFGMPPELFSTMQTWLGPNANLAPREFELPRQLGMVLSWERAWRHTAWLHRKQPRLLEAVLKDRALAPFREHLGAYKKACGARMISQAAVTVVTGDTSPRVEGRVEGIGMRATAFLPGSWVVNVWGRGLALVDGAFVLDVTDASADAASLAVRAVRWEVREGGRCAPVIADARIARDDTEAWRLTWDDGKPTPSST